MPPPREADGPGAKTERTAIHRAPQRAAGAKPSHTMSDDNTREQQEADQSGGVLKRLKSLLNFTKPGTKEDLEHEIQELLEEGEEHGLISSLEEKMINSILEFRETYASEIMTPAAEIVSFNEAAPMAELIDMVIESGFTRIPIYRDNPDHVIGAIHAKDLLKLCARANHQPGPVNLESYLRPVYFISESKPIVDLLREFQKRKLHMAMVVDEFGTVRGLITLEDILEEIVGEIEDEHDEALEGVRRQADGTVMVDGWVAIRDLNRALDWDLPDDDAVTVAGLVIHEAQTIPKVGQTWTFHGHRFQVVKRERNQITALRVSPRQEVAGD